VKQTIAPEELEHAALTRREARQVRRATATQQDECVPAVQGRDDPLGRAEETALARPQAHFRRTLPRSGGDIFKLSKILGHSSVAITQQVYAHLHPDAFAQDYSRVAFAMPEKSGIS